MKVKSVGHALHKVRGETRFDPVRGVIKDEYSETIIHVLGGSKGVDLINKFNKPTALHEAEGCINLYTASFEVTSYWQGYTDVSHIEKGALTAVQRLIDTPKKTTLVDLSCEAPQGMQINKCFFQVTVDHEVTYATILSSEKHDRDQSTAEFRRAKVKTTGSGASRKFETFVKE